MRAGEVPLALVVPRGFGDRPLTFARGAEGTPSLLLLADRADPIAPQVVQGLVQKVSFSALGDLFLAGGLEALDSWGAEFTGAQRERFDQMVAFLREQGASALGARRAPTARGCRSRWRCATSRARGRRARW
ncbi:MAG: hypothetical protein M5U13_13915 [Thermoanaerobaculia bacterium]|nr:hypothetical protein [Thermoanaerobaculia bacterium]